MTNEILTYLGSLFLLGWGIAHLVVTRSVVAGFGDISTDNRKIITMEWITEGAALLFVAVVVACATYVDHTSPVAVCIRLLSFIMLNALSIISLRTGFRVDMAPFKLCPVIFTGSSILILLGTYL